MISKFSFLRGCGLKSLFFLKRLRYYFPFNNINDLDKYRKKYNMTKNVGGRLLAFTYAVHSFSHL